MKKQNGKQENWSIPARVLGGPQDGPPKARSIAGHLGAWTSSGELSQNTQESVPTSQVLKPVESMWIRNQGPSTVQLPASYSLPNPFPTGIKEEPTSIPFHPSQAPRSTCQNFAPECAFNGASKVVLVVKYLLAKAGDLRDAGLIHGLGDPLE